jgi:predicted transcriptional regulator
MNAKLQQFRNEAVSVGPTKAGRKFPKELRALGAAYASERRAANATWREVAAELGVGVLTVQRWCEDMPATNGFARVAIVEDRRRGAFSASIGALRIEGLDFEALVALAKALS